MIPKNGEEAALPIQLKECDLRTGQQLFVMPAKSIRPLLTISSLHIGQTSRLEAAVAAAEPLSFACEAATAALISVSSREDFDVDRSECSEVVLSEGDSGPVLGRSRSGTGDAAAGSLEAPNTRLLPRTRGVPEAIACCYGGSIR